jgi:hypothetical protein
VPVPGWQLVPVLARPRDRLVRYHAWQGGALSVLIPVGLIALGALVQASNRHPAVGLLVGLWLLMGAVLLVWGALGAARHRYPRLMPAWHLLSFIRR